MSTRTVLAAALGLALLAPPAFAAQPAAQARQTRPHSVNAREHRQALRIKRGVKDQQLTRGEINRLRADRARLRASERAFRLSGRGLTPVERRNLQKRLNATSRHIFRLEHNNRTRKGLR
jgi:hypothetical protein